MIFDYLLNNKLIFNTSWEDPQIDLELLDINDNSKILNIGSAGDNSFEYLLQNPELIYVCEINKAQIALIEFKKILFQYSDYKTLSKFFIEGFNPDYKEDYIKLRSYFSSDSKKYWDKHITYFSGKRQSFYYHGASGYIAYHIQKLLKKDRELSKEISSLLNNTSSDFKLIEEKIWNSNIIKFLSLPFVHNLLGVPSSQIKLSGFNEISENIRISLRNHFNNYPNSNNYFWYLYFHGKYSNEICPNYLKEENFKFIKDNIEKLVIVNKPIIETIDKDNFNIINLLDHQDWHLLNNKSYINQLWNKVKSRKSIEKVLFRTVSNDTTIFDNFNNGYFHLTPYSNKDLNYIDRVSTYFNTCLVHRINNL